MLNFRPVRNSKGEIDGVELLYRKPDAEPERRGRGDWLYDHVLPWLVPGLVWFVVLWSACRRAGR